VGNINNSSLLNSTTTISTFPTDTDTGTYNYISNYIGQTLSWNNLSCKINNTTTLYELENAWPYKIQYKANQWYQVLTNGQKSALLTLPYWNTDANEASDVKK